jgi:hypothetical protein
MDRATLWLGTGSLHENPMVWPLLLSWGAGTVVVPMTEGKPTSQAGVFQPDVILPAQFFDVRGRQLSAEQRLMAAVLEDAVQCFQKHLFARNTEQRRLFREAAAWLLDDKSTGPFSFHGLCHALDLEPSYIRRGLERWRKQQLDTPPDARNRTIQLKPPTNMQRPGSL